MSGEVVAQLLVLTAGVALLWRLAKVQVADARKQANEHAVELFRIREVARATQRELVDPKPREVEFVHTSKSGFELWYGNQLEAVGELTRKPSPVSYMKLSSHTYMRVADERAELWSAKEDGFMVKAARGETDGEAVAHLLFPDATSVKEVW